MAEAKRARVRNTTTGVVVNVREDKVARLGNAWGPADKADKADQATQTKQTKQQAEPPQAK